MRTRPTARMIVVDEHQRILLLRYEDKKLVHSKPEVNQPGPHYYWITPGGGVEATETYAQAALRELWEETGIKDVKLGPPVLQCERTLAFPDGEVILFSERYFLVRVAGGSINLDNLI